MPSSTKPRRWKRGIIGAVAVTLLVVVGVPFVYFRFIQSDPPPKLSLADGKLLMHGTTKAVTFTLNARRTGNVIAVQGLEPITFADYGIDNPSGGPASVGNSGQLEFVLQFQANQ